MLDGGARILEAFEWSWRFGSFRACVVCFGRESVDCCAVRIAFDAR